MPLYNGVASVGRKVKELYGATNGVARKVKELYGATNGVARKAHSSTGNGTYIVKDGKLVVSTRTPVNGYWDSWTTAITQTLSGYTGVVLGTYGSDYINSTIIMTAEKINIFDYNKIRIKLASVNGDTRLRFGIGIEPYTSSSGATGSGGSLKTVVLPQTSGIFEYIIERSQFANIFNIGQPTGNFYVYAENIYTRYVVYELELIK